MKRMKDEIVRFLRKQNFFVVATVGPDGIPHTSCKGIVKVSRNGQVYLLDLYTGTTYRNLQTNPRISLTAVDEHRFKGYCLKGKARIASRNEFTPSILKAWQDRITGRITHRLIKNIKGERGHPQHPEARLPKPEYLVVMDVEEVVDLTPQHIK
jgi:uncharacterized pyridoxamine 5'-phosphate oxidase family protein